MLSVLHLPALCFLYLLTLPGLLTGQFRLLWTSPRPGHQRRGPGVEVGPQHPTLPWSLSWMRPWLSYVDFAQQLASLHFQWQSGLIVGDRRRRLWPPTLDTEETLEVIVYFALLKPCNGPIPSLLSLNKVHFGEYFVQAVMNVLCLIFLHCQATRTSGPCSPSYPLTWSPCLP